ncbi:Late embryogenesis abundant protein [Sesbania bispinosa]|nr:Late embryogenesis abundant protein [Sesbania bispinosa]
MSHGQPMRPQPEEPIKYGDVFDVSGELASKTISPQAAAAMQAAEARVLGQPQRGSPAAAMQAAAVINEASGLIGRHGIADMASDQGISIMETTTGGQRIITEAVDGQILGQRVERDAPVVVTNIGSAAIDGDPITIGEALEAVAISVGDKPVDQNDAAAIGAAEMRATGEKNVRPGGVGATAQSAADLNSNFMRREDMTKISDVLTDAAEKLPMDKAVTKEDADAVYAAEVQFQPGGVAASMATAAKLNEEK